MTKLSNISEIVGKNIRNIRLFKRLTTKELAELCGLSPGHLQMLETGRRRINVDHIFAIAQALGVTPEKLINPDITSYFPSQRTLPLVKISDLNDFSTCPDKDSVEEIADQICLCPPGVDDPRTFAVDIQEQTDLPPQKPQIIVCVPSKIEELPYMDAISGPSGAWFGIGQSDEERDVATIPPAFRPHSLRDDGVLVKLSRWPVSYARFRNLHYKGDYFLELREWQSEKFFWASPKVGATPSFLDWVCYVEAFYTIEIAKFMSARKRPSKEE